MFKGSPLILLYTKSSVMEHRLIPDSEWIEKAKEFKTRFPEPCVWILTPCYGSQCYIQYMTCLIRTLDLFRMVDIPLKYEFCRNDSLVSRARNNLVARAMSDPKMTHILFIDNDITWKPADILKLLFSEKNLVGGIYPQKKYFWSSLISAGGVAGGGSEPLTELLEKYETSPVKSMVSREEFVRYHALHYNVNFKTEFMPVQNNLCSVKHIATGFMMIRREALNLLMEAFPSTKYVDDVHFLEPHENQFAYALFDCGVEDGHYYSEDWMFCHRWSNLGGEIFMDVSIPLTHTGTEDFQGYLLPTLSIRPHTNS